MISARDDGIVVVEVGKGESKMPRLRVVPALRQQLGDDGTEALTELVFTATQEWRDDVMNAVESRFERRLTQEIGGLRVDVAKEHAAMRVELAAMRVENLRWSFVFWISQLGAVAGLLSYFK